MKKLFLLCLLPLLAFNTDASLSQLNGAYRQAGRDNGPAASGTDLTLLFDGHWVRVRYHNGPGSVQGGTFYRQADRYAQQTGYCSTNPGATVAPLVFDYTPEEGKLCRHPAGEKDPEEPCRDYARKLTDSTPLRHRNLEGVWQLEGFGINDACPQDKLLGLACLQYNVYPEFVRVSYQVATGKVLGVATGRYTYDYPSSTCTQTVEYSSSPEIRAGQVFTRRVTLHDNSFELGTPDPYSPQVWISATAQ
jgi:hypothetical protein